MFELVEVTTVPKGKAERSASPASTGLTGRAVDKAPDDPRCSTTPDGVVAGPLDAELQAIGEVRTPVMLANSFESSNVPSWTALATSIAMSPARAAGSRRWPSRAGPPLKFSGSTSSVAPSSAVTVMTGSAQSAGRPARRRVWAELRELERVGPGLDVLEQLRVTDRKGPRPFGCPTGRCCS